MTTAIQGVYNGYSISNLSQIQAYTEGVSTLALSPFSLTTSVNYSRVYTLTLTIVSANYANLNIVQSNTSGPLLVKAGAIYTISSEYINSQGVKVNNWALFKLAIQGLTLQFKNSDWGETFNIETLFSDGTTTGSDFIQVVTTPVVDATGNNQTVTVGMAMNGQSLTTVGGTNIAINDVNEAAKTYRVTFTPANTTNSSGTSDIKTSLSGTWATPLILTGTQSSINAQMTSSGNGNGLNFNQYNMDFYGSTSVSYKQEVLTTTEVGVIVPYVQETGSIIFNTTYTAPFAISPNPTYSEDSSVTFSLGSITDLAGTNYSHETCGVYEGYNCYTVTATVAGSFSSTNPVVLTYAGDVSLNNSITFTGSKTACNSFLSSVTLIPPADYIDPLTINITLTRGNTPVTIYTGAITATCSSTHSEFSIIGGAAFIIGNSTINFGSITDLASSKNYTVTIDGLQSSIDYGTLTDLSGVGTWSNTGGAGGFGRLTISGTKAILNTSLAAIRYSTGTLSVLGDSVGFTYTQIQTTNSLSQGVGTIFLNNNYIWGTGNYSGNYVFDENTKTMYNLGSINVAIAGTAIAEITLSTAFSTANGGSITGWTKVSDTVWTFSGTKAAVNAALVATEFVPPADRQTNFTVDMKIYDDITVVYSSVAFSATKTFSIRTTYAKFSILSTINELIGGNSLPINLGSITDVRPDNISSSITYSIVLTPASLSEITSLTSGGSGGTTSWSGSTLTITGTKTQINSHLATITMVYNGVNNTTIAYTQTQTTNSVSQSGVTITIIKPSPQFMFFTHNQTVRSSDLTTWDVDVLATIPAAGNYWHYPTYRQSRWGAGHPLLQSGNIATLYKSTTTDWTENNKTIADTTFYTLPQNLRGSAGNSAQRAFLYGGATSGGVGFLNLIYTADDNSYNSVSLDLTTSVDSLGKYAHTANKCSISCTNGVFNVFYIITDPYDSSRKYLKNAYSTNGINWTLPTFTFLSFPSSTDISYLSPRVDYVGTEHHMFVKVGDTLYNYYSTNGTAWSSIVVSGAYSGSSGSATSIATTSNCVLGPYNYPTVIINNGGTAIACYRVTSSPYYWIGTSLGVPYANLYPDSSSLAGHYEILMARNGNTLFKTTNLTSWSTVSMGFTPYAIFDIKWYNGWFYVLAATSNNNCVLMKSITGNTWTTVYTFPTGSNWTEMAYSA
jgi:hypothetical protein